jgi:flagellar assembly factor FliW
MTIPPQEELPTIEFVTPMPGFPDQRRFFLVRVDEDGLLLELTSVDDPELRFLVVPPPAFFPSYGPEIPWDTLSGLGLTADQADQVLMLLVVTVGDSPGQTTANLMAPIIVDEVSRRAVQVVLSDSDLPVRAQLMPTA